MASRYLSAGYSVYGEARSREGLEHLLDEGLSWCDTPREVAQSADIVITSIPNDEVLREKRGLPRRRRARYSDSPAASRASCRSAVIAMRLILSSSTVTTA